MAESDEVWRERWLDAVAAGSATMSQRRLATIERRGGVDAVVAEARARGVHLVRLTDDAGHVVVAASLHPFEVLS